MSRKLKGVETLTDDTTAVSAFQRTILLEAATRGRHGGRIRAYLISPNDAARWLGSASQKKQ
jgi:hypothetical protein